MGHYKIKKEEYRNYKKRTGVFNKLDLIWSDILVQLSDQARIEARSGWYELAESDKDQSGGIVLEIRVPQGSSQLLRELKNVGNRVLVV
ncbi:MAG: hypothetical protein ACOCXP_02965 [Candidatus Dojkabacteria bacterium]